MFKRNFFEKIIGSVNPKLAVRWVTEELLRILNYSKKDIDEVTNLHHFSVIAVKYPWTIPLVRVLIKFPPSRIFDMIFSISQGIEWLIWSRMGLIRMLKHAIKNYSKF